ncbi:NAD(P)-dependent oxidoreductase [Microvirga sp. 2TAF3]|uniref:NAD(P)-dependent oxidoreductase n=1 Tax=Microvirga sp. 2TAF3 TaxID=3233014 RepID=UPI003F9C9C68
MDIGFLGLGHMGRAMAANLVKAGHRVRVWNRSRPPIEALVAQGAVAANDPGEAFQGDAVISMLADDAALRAVLTDGGLLTRSVKPAVHVSMATISVAFARELAEAHARAGIAFLSAPVFGRPDVAAAGQLQIVCAGEEAATAQVRPLLDVLGQRIWPVGREPHQANAVKLAGNFMLAAAIEAMGEASALVRAYGVEASDLLNILTNTLFASPVYKGYGGLISENRYEPPGFKLALGAKDIRLVLAAGDDARVPLPTASVLHDSLLEALAYGDGDKDLAALARVAARRARQDEPA